MLYSQVMHFLPQVKIGHVARTGEARGVDAIAVEYIHDGPSQFIIAIGTHGVALRVCEWLTALSKVLIFFASLLSFLLQNLGGLTRGSAFLLRFNL